MEASDGRQEANDTKRVWSEAGDERTLHFILHLLSKVTFAPTFLSIREHLQKFKKLFLYLPSLHFRINIALKSTHLMYYCVQGGLS